MLGDELWAELEGILVPEPVHTADYKLLRDICRVNRALLEEIKRRRERGWKGSWEGKWRENKEQSICATDVFQMELGSVSRRVS